MLATSLVWRAYSSHGADVEAADTKGWTALHSAAFSQREDVVAVLLMHGASIKAVESRGQTPLHVATERGNKPIAALLLDDGADVNSRDNEGNTPLHEATAHLGDVSAIRLLLERGANPLAKARESTTFRRCRRSWWRLWDSTRMAIN
ncbi:MAG TPA: ankyrin repeat domain-containing protein [Candidatus Binatia bacterium]